MSVRDRVEITTGETTNEARMLVRFSFTLGC
jgi:hypothetical protein